MTRICVSLLITESLYIFNFKCAWYLKLVEANFANCWK